ncbi:acyltransferase [Novosphingobium sp. B-7]|uniref:acyltransferase family protein n=1 Tax=Novosphingobium sp. B-7 TaxID=1298855 RepID=UPI0003B74A6C|nr:acyltransferase [Novosphingobium sp. B-7]
MNQKRELIGIQFLRGFCALGVVIGHAAGMLAKPKYGGLEILGGMLEIGTLGVDIFFIISGFIIAVVVLNGPDLAPRMSIGAFLRRRFIRIVPMMWLAIVSYALLQRVFAREGIDLGAYLRAIFLVPYSVVKPDIIWTLRQELIFYIVFALCFFWPRWGRWVLVLWLVSPIAFLLSLGSIWHTTAYIDTFWSVLCSTVNLEFGMGLALGILWVRHAPVPSLRVPVHPFWLLAVASCAIVGASWALGLASQTLPSVLFIGSVGTLVVGLAARADCPDGWLTALGRLLGDASYSIYLFHLHVLAGFLAIRMKLGVFNNAPVALVVTVVAAVAVSVAIHLWIERPLTQRLRAKFAGRAARGPLPVAA